MQRISVFGASAAAIAASMLNSVGGTVANAARGIHRVAAGTKRARQMVSKTAHNRSKYMPHTGAKEQERAKRLYESRYLNDQFVTVSTLMGANLSVSRCHERSAPTVCQMSKRQYAALQAQRQAA